MALLLGQSVAYFWSKVGGESVCWKLVMACERLRRRLPLAEALYVFMKKSKTTTIPVSQQVLAHALLALVCAIMLIFFIDESFTHGHMTANARVKTFFPNATGEPEFFFCCFMLVFFVRSTIVKQRKLKRRLSDGERESI